MRKPVFIFSFFLVISTTLFAQKPLEGYINYSFKVLGDGAETIESMMPSSMELYSSKKSIMVKINGGLMGNMMGDMITTAKGSYMVKHDEKTVYNMGKGEKKADSVNVVKEDEKITIAGLECQKYKVTKTDAKGEQTSYVWINSDYKFPVTGGKGAENMGVPGVPGIALKIMTSQGGFTVVISALEFKTGKQDKKYFTIPKGYAKKDSPPSLTGF